MENDPEMIKMLEDAASQAIIPLNNAEQQAWQQGRIEAIKQFSKTYYLRHYVNQFMEKGELPVPALTDADKEILSISYNRIATKPPFMLVTINPKPDVLYNELLSKVQKFLKKKTIISYICCFEVRAKNGNEYTGLHCHVLVKYDDQPYNFKRGSKNTFKTVCNSDDPHVLNFKFVTEDLIESKIDYILGIKTEKKSVGVNVTDEWRKAYKIPEVLESSPPFPCRATQLIN